MRFQSPDTTVIAPPAVREGRRLRGGEPGWRFSLGLPLSGRFVPVAIMTVIFAALLLPPMAMLIYSSFKASGDLLPFQVPGLSLANFQFIIHNPATYQVLGNTAIYVIGAGALGMTLAVSLTYLLERTDLPGRQFLRSFILAPMAVPGLVMAIAWTFVAGNNGPLTIAFRHLFGITPNIYSLGGMVLVTGLLTTPSTYLLISPQFARFDGTLEDAASVSGASWWRRSRRVVLPLLLPAIFSAGMLLVVIALEAFDVPAVLGFPRDVYVFSTLIQQELQPPTGAVNYGGASAYGVLLVLVAVILVVFYRNRIGVAERYRTITGKGFRPPLVRLGRWRYVASAAVIVYCLVGLVAPLFMLVTASLLPYFSLSAATLRQISLNAYVQVFTSPDVLSGVEHTLIVLVVAATVATILAFAAGWVANHGGIRFGWLLVEGSYLMVGVPGVILALTLLLIYLQLPLPIYGTVWIIILAYVTRSLAYTTRLMDSAFKQLDHTLYEAGQVAGGSGIGIQWRIVFPLMRTAITRTWLAVAVRSAGELPIALILTNTDNQTLPVVLWDLWNDGTNTPEACAVAVLLIVVSAVGILFLLRTERSVMTGPALGLNG